MALFRLSADPAVAMLNGNPLSEFNVGNSTYCSPVFANGTLYVASRDRLFAIKDDGSLPAGDWSQWRGPERNNISVEWGLLQEWPVGGPPLVWRTDGIGDGDCFNRCNRRRDLYAGQLRKRRTRHCARPGHRPTPLEIGHWPGHQ